MAGGPDGELTMKYRVNSPLDRLLLPFGGNSMPTSRAYSCVPIAAAASVPTWCQPGRSEPGCCQNRSVSDQTVTAGYEHPPGPVADAFERRMRAREETELSPLATRSYPAV